jgi:hypothetical protein
MDDIDRIRRFVLAFQADMLFQQEAAGEVPLPIEINR